VLSFDDGLEQNVVFCQEAKSNNDYFKAFNSLVSVYEHLGRTLIQGTAFDDEIDTLVKASTQDEKIVKKKAAVTIHDKVLSTAFIK